MKSSITIMTMAVLFLLSSCGGPKGKAKNTDAKQLKLAPVSELNSPITIDTGEILKAPLPESTNPPNTDQVVTSPEELSTDIVPQPESGAIDLLEPVNAIVNPGENAASLPEDDSKEDDINVAPMPKSFPTNLFLIKPGEASGSCADGSFSYQITTEQLYSDEKYRVTYKNLQKIAKKSCNPHQIKDQYLGPWDAELYLSDVMVWIDANGNSKADCGEIISLQEAKIAAINACEILPKQESDKNHAITENRSPILKFKEKNLPNDLDILHRLSTGKTLSGEQAEFRWAFDLKQPVK